MTAAFVDEAIEAARADAGRGAWLAVRDRLRAVESSLRGRPDAQVLYAESLLRAGQARDARVWLDAALPEVRRRDDRLRMRRSHLMSGAADFQLGALDAAIHHFERAIELASADGDDLTVAQATNNLGAIADLRNDRPRALQSYRAAIPAYQRMGHVHGLAQTFHNMAITYREQGKLTDAEELERLAIMYAQTAGDRGLVAMAHLERAVIRLRLHDPSMAAAIAARAAEEFHRLQATAHEADAWRVRALARLELGALEDALADSDVSIALIERMPNLLIDSECRRDRARVLLRLGRVEDARAELARARAGFAQLGADREVTAIDAQREL